MKKLAVLLATALVAASAFAAAGWVGAGVVNVNGKWYYADQHESTTWADGAFSGQTFDFADAASFQLAGQVQLWDSGSADWGSGTTATMLYKIDDAADFTAATLTYYKFESNNNFFQSGGADFATESVSLAGLDAGNHTLTVKFVDIDNLQPTAEYTANFTTSAAAAVPEPATMSLLGLGALAMVLRRKLRK